MSKFIASRSVEVPVSGYLRASRGEAVRRLDASIVVEIGSSLLALEQGEDRRIELIASFKEVELEHEDVPGRLTA